MIKNILEVITLNKLKLSIMFILTLIVSIGTVYVVYARVDIVNTVVYKTGSLWYKVAIIICILIAVELLRAWLKIIVAQLIRQWKIYLGDRISENIENMPQSDFNKVDSGEHMAKITNFQFIIHKKTTDDINNTIELSKLVSGENKYADNNSN